MRLLYTGLVAGWGPSFGPAQIDQETLVACQGVSAAPGKLDDSIPARKRGSVLWIVGVGWGAGGEWGGRGRVRRRGHYSGPPRGCGCGCGRRGWGRRVGRGRCERGFWRQGRNRCKRGCAARRGRNGRGQRWSQGRHLNENRQIQGQGLRRRDSQCWTETLPSSAEPGQANGGQNKHNHHNYKKQRGAPPILPEGLPAGRTNRQATATGCATETAADLPPLPLRLATVWTDNLPLQDL